MTSSTRASVSPGAPVMAGRPEAARPKVVAGVKLWALVGAVVFVFEAYVLLRWVTGPNFTAVPPGPTPVPDGIKIAGSVITFAGFPAMFYLLYRFVWKPWRTERRVTTEGLLMVWFATLS